MDKKLFDQLAEIYEDAGYPSLAKFKPRVKKAGIRLTDKQLKKFLEDQQGFQMFKQRHIKKKKTTSQYTRSLTPGRWTSPSCQVASMASPKIKASRASSPSST